MHKRAIKNYFCGSFRERETWAFGNLATMVVQLGKRHLFGHKKVLSLKQAFQTPKQIKPAHLRSGANSEQKAKFKPEKFVFMWAPKLRCS